MPTYGERVAALRKARGYTQIEFANASGLNQSIISRIETGKNVQPEPETLEKMAKALEVSIEEVTPRRIERIEVKESPVSPVNVAFAYCLWSAPIIDMALKNIKDDNFRFSSWDALPPGKDSFPKPEFLNQDILDKILLQKETMERYEKQWYSAAHLEKCVLNNSADIVIASFSVLSKNPQLVPCARLVVASGKGVSLLVYDKNKHQGLFEYRKKSADYTTIHCIEVAIKKLPSNESINQIPTYYAGETIAAERIRSFNKEVRNLLDPKMIDVGNWQETEKLMIGSLEEKGYFLFLGWEPYISWIKAKLKELGKDEDYLESLNFGSLYRETLFSFDLIIRHPRYLSGQKDAGFYITQIKRLLLGVRTSINALNRELRSVENPNTDDADDLKFSPITMNISQYLNMESSACKKEMMKMNFDYLYYPQWLEILQDYSIV